MICQKRLDICQRVRQSATKISPSSRLAGWCAICSTALALEFKNNNFDSEIHLTENFEPFTDHCFVVSDCVIYDITASQFGSKYKDIHIEVYSEDYKSVDVIQPNWREINSLFADWLSFQRPTKPLIKKILNDS